MPPFHQGFFFFNSTPTLVRRVASLTELESDGWSKVLIFGRGDNPSEPSFKEFLHQEGGEGRF